MKRTGTLGLSMVLVALLACKSEQTGKETPPTEVTAASTPTTAQPPAVASVAEERPAEPQAKAVIPTEGNSKPPSVAEWNAVGEITVRHSTPLQCETKLVREWLRVSCRSNEKSKYLIYGVKLTDGKDSGGIPPFVKKGVASIVTRVKQGMSAEYTFDWGSFTRKLTVAWPNGAPAPTIEFDSAPPQ